MKKTAWVFSALIVSFAIFWITMIAAHSVTEEKVPGNVWGGFFDLIFFIAGIGTQGGDESKKEQDKFHRIGILIGGISFGLLYGFSILPMP